MPGRSFRSEAGPNELHLYTGTLIKDLYAPVERAERSAGRARAKNRAPVWPMVVNGARVQETQSPKSSRKRFVCARLTGISLCFLSSMRSW